MEVSHLVSPQEELAFPGGSLRVLGASRSVTGAMSLFKFDGSSLLVDCGMAMGRDAERSFPEEAATARAVILTHGHLDHVGALPDRWRQNPEPIPIFGTPTTLALATIVLEDSLRLAGAPQRERREFFAWYRKGSTGIRHDTWHVPWEGLRFVFREAGHILGSSSVGFRSAKARVIASGDLGRHAIPILKPPFSAWDPEPPVDLVLMESTYGNRTHPASDSMDKELERIIHHALRDGGPILIPAFAIGRTQTLLYHLNTLVEAGRIPSLPVAVDTPMGIRVTALYESARHLYDEEALALLARGDDPLDFDQLYAVRKGVHSAALREISEPVIIIAGNGMCTGGRILGHLRELVGKPETDVVFVGYQVKGTPGRAILEAGLARLRDGKDREVDLNGEVVTVRALVHQLPGLSAHADQQELIAWLKGIPSPAKVVLHHGEPEAQRELAIRL